MSFFSDCVLFVLVQLEEDKKSVEEELKEKKSALALQSASSSDRRPSKVCDVWLCVSSVMGDHGILCVVPATCMFVAGQ